MEAALLSALSPDTTQGTMWWYLPGDLPSLQSTNVEYIDDIRLLLQVIVITQNSKLIEKEHPSDFR